MAKLIAEILKLSKEERWAIAMQILDSIREEEHDLSPEYLAEIERRISAVEKGGVAPLTEKQFWAELKE